MKRTFRKKDILYPERNINNLLKDYYQGRLSSERTFYRAVVLAIDTIGGILETNPPNPRNSIKARLLTDSADSFIDNDNLQIFWPLNPYDTYPIKEGEHVYILFEDENKQNGLWISRIAEPNNTDNRNKVLGITKYQQANPDAQITEKLVQDLDEDPLPITGSAEFIIENVPKFQQRIGDRVVEGSNNTLIILGRDRVTDVASGQAIPAAGSIDIIAGRSDELDLNPGTDKSRISITMNSDVDTNFSVPASLGAASGPSAAIVVKSDQVRVIARNGMKVFVENGDLNIDAANINIGGQQNATHQAVLGDQLASFLSTLLNQLSALTVVTAFGPAPLNPSVIQQLQQHITQELTNLSTSPILSQTVKIKQ